jgi:twinkle protein
MFEDKTLYELLADEGIHVKSLEAGLTRHIDCPHCQGGNHFDKRTLSVTIDKDGRGAAWVCHRGSCGWNGGVHEKNPDYGKPHSQPKPQKPNTRAMDAAAAAIGKKPEWVYKFFAERKIGARTVDQFNVSGGHRNFPGLGDRPCMIFPYYWRNNLVTIKYRPHPEKTPQSQINDGPPVVYNAHSLEDAVACIWVEGEPDVLAVYEAGVTSELWNEVEGNVAVVSLRDGAPATATFRSDDKRFAALTTHADEIARIKTHYLAGDNDAPGLALREELARRLGRNKVRLVEWPEGCKDACDALKLDDGVDAINDAIASAKPYPIEGVRDIEAGLLDKLYHAPSVPVMDTGLMSTDAILRLPTEGRLIVMTGVPSHGKTAYTRFLMCHTILHHQRKWLVFTAEEYFDTFIIDCAQVIERQPFRQGMTGPQRIAANAILSKSLRIVETESERNPPTVDNLIERAIYSVLRDGTTDFLIDPWNEIEHQKGDQSETDYISRSLQRFKAFAKQYGCNVWIVAHPAKPPPLRPGESRRPPTGYDISGSANWFNKCDVGLTVHVREAGQAELIVWKSRSHRWATIGRKAKMDFDQNTGRYLEPIVPDTDAIKPHNEVD